MLGEQESSYGDLNFGAPEYMNDMGAPGMTDQGHAMQPPFQTQPIHQFQPEYAAPGMTDAGHAMKPPFQTQPIHQFQPEYASPGMTDQGHAMKPPFQTQPIPQFQPEYAAPGFTDQGHAMKPPFQTQPLHQFPTYGAASPTIAPGIYQIKSNRRTFAVSATGTIAAQDQMGLSIGSASPGEASWSGWVKEIQSAKADNDLAFSPAKASGWQSAADALSAFATGIGAKFEPSGTDVASDMAAASNTQSGSNFGKIALWTVGGLAAAGLVWWGISAMNKD